MIRTTLIHSVLMFAFILPSLARAEEKEEPHWIKKAGTAIDQYLDFSAVFTGGVGYMGEDSLNVPQYSELYKTELKNDGILGFNPERRDRQLQFQMQQLKLTVSGHVDRFARAELSLTMRDGAPQIYEGYVESLALPWGLRAKGGQFLVDFGHENGSHFIETSPFVDLSVSQRLLVGEQQLSLLGAGLGWKLPVRWNSELMVSVGIPRSRSFAIQTVPGLGDHNDLIASARFNNVFWCNQSLRYQIGVSYAMGPNTQIKEIAAPKDQRGMLAGADMELRFVDRSSPRYIAGRLESIYRRSTVNFASSDNVVTQDLGLTAAVDARVLPWLQTSARFDYLGLLHDQSGDWPVPSLNYPKVYAATPVTWAMATALSVHVSENHRWRVQYQVEKPVDTTIYIHSVFLQAQFALGRKSVST